MGSNGVRTMPNGQPMSFQLTVPGPYTDWVSDVEVVASNLKDIGIQANVVTPAVDQWTSNVYNGRFDMAINIGDFGATPFEFFRGMMSSETYVPVGQTSTDNVGRYRNAQADQILNKWVQTSDEGTWKSLAKQLQQIFVNEAPAIPIYGQPLWGSDNSLHFSDFPSPSNAYAPLGAASGATQFVTSLIVLTTVKPA
jgi:peptide/nickel transport system substrate-binding protein